MPTHRRGDDCPDLETIEEQTMSEFRFTDEEWRAYQAMPDQGYSHRDHLESVVNRWLVGHDRLASRESWEQGWNAHEFDMGEE